MREEYDLYSLTKISRFLLISLTMDVILAEPTAYGRRQRLRAMTEGLDLKGVYGVTLERIKEQGGEKARLGIAALMWVSHSERLLQLDEVFHALAVEIGSTDLNVERIPSVEVLFVGIHRCSPETPPSRFTNSTCEKKPGGLSGAK